MKNPQTADNILVEVLRDYGNLKFGFGGDTYFPQMIDTYSRTIADILKLKQSNPHLTRILEIGAFVGIVSTALSRCGFHVTAHDVPKVSTDDRLREHYGREGITPVSFLLQDRPYPLPDASFDLIVFCEVLEHLNFNPLPVLSEFRRLLKPEGLIYVATPNQTSLVHRLMILGGKSFYYPVSYFQDGIDPESLAAFGYHWHEFTQSELIDLFRLRNFELVRHDFCRYVSRTESNWLRRSVVSLIYRLAPSLMQCQVAVFRKLG